MFPDDTGESAGKSGTETFLEGFNIYESLEEKYDQLLRDGLRAVSYTHLDVYKRQTLES